MLAKVMVMEPVPGALAELSAAQTVWDRECRDTPGYRGQLVGTTTDGRLIVIAGWQTRQDYEAWMQPEHDRIAALARSDLLYTSLQVELVDSIEGKSMQSLLDRLAAP